MRSVLIDGGAGLSGDGTGDGPVTNNGGIEPFGNLVIGGDYIQGSGGTLTNYFNDGRLDITGAARLAGTFDIIARKVCPPPPRSHYTALTYWSHSDLFSTVTPGFKLTVSSTSIEVTKL